MADRLHGRLAGWLSAQDGNLGGSWLKRARLSASDAEQLEALRRLDGVMGAAVHRLPEDDQRFLALRFAGGLSVAQVARATHRTREAVRMQQLLTLRALQHELESHAS